MASFLSRHFVLNSSSFQFYKMLDELRIKKKERSKNWHNIKK